MKRIVRAFCGHWPEGIDGATAQAGVQARKVALLFLLAVSAFGQISSFPPASGRGGASSVVLLTKIAPTANSGRERPATEALDNTALHGESLARLPANANCSRPPPKLGPATSWRPQPYSWRMRVSSARSGTRGWFSCLIWVKP